MPWNPAQILGRRIDLVREIAMGELNEFGHKFGMPASIVRQQNPMIEDYIDVLAKPCGLGPLRSYFVNELAVFTLQHRNQRMTVGCSFDKNRTRPVTPEITKELVL